MKKCFGSVKTRNAKPTYKIFIDWDAKKKYLCDLCDKHYENLENFHQHFFADHKSKNTSKNSKSTENDSYKANLKTDDNEQDLDKNDPLHIVNDEESSILGI